MGIGSYRTGSDTCSVARSSDRHMRCGAITPASAIRRQAGTSRDVSWPRSSGTRVSFTPRVGFIVTNLARPAERVVAFYNRRGTAEQCWCGRPPRHRLCQNEVVADLRRWGPSVEQISRIGMDTSKHFFQLHGVNAADQPVLRKKLRRKDMVASFKNLRPTVIAIEACGTSHYWARLLRSFGVDS